MPDDDLFSTTEGEPNSDDTTPQGTSGAGGTPPNSGSPALSHDDLAKLVEQFVQPNTDQMERITQNQRDLGEAIKNISERIGLGGNGEARADDGVDVSEFLSDPSSHIAAIAKGVADAQVRESVGPLLAQMVQQTYDSTLKTQEAAVDAEFGSGAWKTHFWPELKPIFDRTQKEAPSQLGNTEAITRAVNTVKGAKFETLAQARQDALKSRQEQSDAERNDLLEIVQSNLTGGIARASGKAVLSEEMKDYIEREFRATGEKTDESSFLASLNSGSTFEDWQAAQKAAKKA